jgi:hypothetical protein
MDSPVGGNAHQELVSVIREVRRRWRMRVLLRGAIIVVVGALAALAIASVGLQSYKFSPASITALRVAVFAAFAVLLAVWLIRPLGRRVSDLQVALYVEEREPSLQAAILAAVDVGGTSPAHREVPRVIVERLVAQAVEKAKTIDGGRAIGRTTIKRQALALTTVAAVAALLLVVGPEFLRQGASALLVLSRSAEAASPYAIKVTPGDVSIPKGSDQAVAARLAGFRSNEVGMWVRPMGETKYERMPLVSTGDAESFEGMLFDLEKPIEYYVEADGVKSPTYSMTIVELPAVAKMELEYVFPAYTGLPPQTIEGGGDVAAIAGTEVRVRITSTMATAAGRLKLDPGALAALTPQADGTLAGSFKIAQDGYYHIELDGPRGENVTASPKYTIDVIEDRPPTVSFEKPRRDTNANPVEEVFVQARAEDDFGVRQLDLVYSVNGGPEKTVPLYGRGAKPLEQVSAGHTIYLEELEVKPGDFVSYYAKAQDTDTVNGPKVTASDIYFVQIRPFSQNFREAQSQAGGGGGGGGGGAGQNEPGALSQKQRQIISATFNVNRDKARMAAEKFKEDTVFIGLSQSRLREEVAELVGQMKQRLGGGGGENLQRIVDLLPKAAAEMQAAEDLLKSQKTQEALDPEKRALKHLQDAEQAYELEVRRQQGGGGGGGGGGGQMASELADLFQLELDRQANQYEQQQRTSQEAQQQEVDEMAERLRELAKRQLMQAEQQQRMRGQQGSASGGGSSQRALADEVENMARQLEQLAREAERQGQPRQDLQDAARRMQESANAMRQSAASGADGGAQAQQAAQRLQEAERLLSSSTAQASGQNVRQLQQQAEALAKRQRQMQSQVAQLDQAGAERQQRAQQLSQEKEAMRNEVADIEQQLGSLARQAASGDQRAAARDLQEAQRSIREQSIKEKIEYSRGLLGTGAPSTPALEQEITSNLETLSGKIGEAAAAADKAEQGQSLNRAVDEMGNTSSTLQSFNEQLNQSTGQGQQGQGQQGQGEQGQGQQGQGQQGQGQQGQGQQGQGQQGQQGQGQQGQGQQGQGQQGQGQQGQGQQGQGQQGQGQQGQGQQGQGRGQGQGQGGQQGQQGGRQGGQMGQGQMRLGQGGQPGDPQAGEAQRTPGGMSGGDSRAANFRGDARQMANQATNLADDVSRVRRQLQQAGISGRDLQPVDEVVKALRALGDEKAYGDPAGLQDLYATALDKYKKLEYDLRKRTDTSNQQLYLSGSENVPPNFKSLVEEYSRQLSRKPVGGGGGKD